tara:strand:+ start:1962 stop:2156 length:195 start_codon:yes stop_codon:yes gene_type:complete
MKFEVISGITIKDKEYKAGATVSKSDIPKKSFTWLLEQGIIVELTKDYIEKKLQNSVKAKDEEE